MTEIRLDYPRHLVPQITGWSCGPAAAEVALATRGIMVAEAELITQVGATERGTDHISQITKVLNRHMPEAGYVVVEMPQDPPSPAQIEYVWECVVRSISAGYPIVANWVAPSGPIDNRPVGVKGSVSPSYPAGVTRHYVTYAGFADGPHADGVPGNRAVWVADSANFGGIQGFWMSARQAATLIPDKGFTWPANTPAVPVETSPAPFEDALDVLIKAMHPTRVTRERMAQLLPYVIECLQRSGCDNTRRISMWCAQIGHESSGLYYTEEIADGSAYEGRADLGNTQPGDGRRFKGRGPIQITGRHNYTELSRWSYQNGYVSSPTAFTDDPELLATPEYGFLGAAHYWTVARPDINTLADAGDVRTVTFRINGGYNGLQDRQQRWDRCRALGDRLLKLTEFAQKVEPVPVVEPPEPEPAPAEKQCVFIPCPEPEQLIAHTPSGEPIYPALPQDSTPPQEPFIHVFNSISPFRPLDDDSVVTLEERVALIDANLHIVLTMLLASIGDVEHLRLLASIANVEGDPAWPARQHDARLARTVLAWAERSGAMEIADEQTAPPEPPPWTCGVTGGECEGGGYGRCSVTVTGRCLSEYFYDQAEKLGGQ